VKGATCFLHHFTQIHNQPTSSLTMATNANESANITVSMIVTAIKEEKPQFRHSFDALIAILHVAMKLHGFRLQGIDDSSAEKKPYLPAGWNSSNDSYSFTYKHHRSSLTFVVKSLMLGQELLVSGVVLEDNKRLYSLQLSVKDYMSENAEMNDYDHLYKNLDKLIVLFKKEIICKFLPDLTTDGASETPTATAPHRHLVDTPRYEPDYDPLRIPSIRPPQGPFMPGFGLPSPPFGVGDHDLYPSFANIPPSRAPGMFSPSGNLIGPHHPGFGPYVTDPYGGPGNFQSQRPPNGGRVPGSRFDAYGPPNPDFPLRNPGDEPPPPGFDNMFL